MKKKKKTLYAVIKGPDDHCSFLPAQKLETIRLKQGYRVVCQSARPRACGRNKGCTGKIQPY